MVTRQTLHVMLVLSSAQRVHGMTVWPSTPLLDKVGVAR
jgi:hypothetical protein